ncbi:hypothetical protein CTI12_AA488480 [Artemisia annua]|uniref:MSP domain-containing protein n=1 Tax=Artemisia annua TaxID=35608 RepID=A0A2U1LI57_ARTAN|nr:hypothetical protein CTI12_AA488480 [Artemisia annua]
MNVLFGEYHRRQQQSLTTYHYFGEIQPEEVRFIFKPKRQISCTVKLFNGSDTGYLAFKVNDDANANLYHVEPNVGVIKPWSTCQVQFTRKAQDVMPPPNEIANETFLLQRAWYSEDISVKAVSNMFLRGHENVNVRKLKVVLEEELKVKVSRFIKSMMSKIAKLNCFKTPKVKE